MTVTHIVIFKTKDDASTSQLGNLVKDMLALKQKCVHPKTKEPYIVSSKGGKQMSIEDNMTKGNTFGFVVEFDNIVDRDYYVKEDRAHREFVEGLPARGVVESGTVFDFVAGEY